MIKGLATTRRKAMAGLAGSVAMAGAAKAQSPESATLEAGPDRTIMLNGKTWLIGQAPLGVATQWRVVSGPGPVHIADPHALRTTASVERVGDYILELAATGGAAARLRLRAEAPPPRERLDVVYTKAYQVDSPLWRGRMRALIVTWLPQCIAWLERGDLTVGAGGIDNFAEAAKALRGEAHGSHKGYVWANAYVHQTVEAMCIALMVDIGDDEDIRQAKAHIRATLERWIPIILSAQEADGYLQTAFTLADRNVWPARWSPKQRGNHEGYVAGYFLESAINHHTLTRGGDLRLYNAAKKLADCWVANIGPGKQEWYDGHQEMEQALIRFGRFVNDMEGQGRGDAYIRLARFLLDGRRGGSPYDQSHLAPVMQYEAVGHAVRATYFYSGMADIAAEHHDVDYQSAVKSLWDSMVNRKYYVTGGIGSVAKHEGFGADYDLRNDAYCESCSSCGLIFFQYKLNLAYHDARYADLYEGTLYNALLGSIDLAGTSYTYTNPLTNTDRARWHDCPCCISNITRTLLMMPTWAYLKGRDAIHVNLYLGSRMVVEGVAGSDVEMVQATDYPWDGRVAITVNPSKPARFALHLRVPGHRVGELYTASPAVGGMTGLAVNGRPVTMRVVNGYAVVERTWQRGDTVRFDLPMAPQRLTAAPQVADDAGRVAIAYGPLIYNVETADQSDITQPLGRDPLRAMWHGDMLDGVVAIHGQWADGSAMTAIPHYARMNRTGRPLADYPAKGEQHGPPLSQVWIRAV